MAGHSKFKNIMHRKGAQDAKRAKVFTKHIREITVAARIGDPDPESNPRLRAAIIAARQVNMPKDNIERAIKRGSGGDEGDNYEEMRYEGYGPGGVAVIVESLTDNRNRTASEIRSTFSKYGGNLGETNSVTFMFDRLGSIEFELATASTDEIFEAALEAGAINVESDDEAHYIQTEPNDLMAVRDQLAEKYGDPRTASLTWSPKTTTLIEKQQAETLFKLLEVLEDNDDVQNVSTNVDIPDDILDEIQGK